MTTAIYEVPLTAKPQVISAQFPNGNTYFLRLTYLFSDDDPCWIMDIMDSNGELLVCGTPLVTGCDLLAQYGYLNFGCQMFCTTDGNTFAVPNFLNLGTTAHLWVQSQ